jgi:hypothetical protein
LTISHKTIVWVAQFLGEDLGSSMKHAIATLLGDNLPTLAILEEYRVSPVLPDIDHVLAGDPSGLLAAVDDLLLPYGQRHTAHLRRKARQIVERSRELIETAKYIIKQNRQMRADSKRERNKKQIWKRRA